MGARAIVVIVVAFAAGAIALAAVSIIDAIEHRIPNRITYSALAICVLFAVAGLVVGLTGQVIAALAGASAFGALLYAPHRLVPEGMGMGDVKLAIPLGFAIGWTQAEVVPTLLTVGWTLAGAALIGLSMAAVSASVNGQRLASGQTVPFGPALSVAGLAAVGLAVF